MWKPDEQLVEETLQKRDALLSEIVDHQEAFNVSDEANLLSLLDLLETLGVRSLMGLEETLSKTHRLELVPLIPHALSALDTAHLEHAAEKILMKAPKLGLLEGDELIALEEELMDLLSVRDRIELVIEGASVILGKEPELPSEVVTATVVFEEMLGDDIWRLLPLGSRRAANVVWIEPSRRQRFWWWERGMDLPATALFDLGTAARLITKFPSAREELEKMLEAESIIEGFGESQAQDNIIDLREYILNQRSNGMRALKQGLPLQSDQVAKKYFSVAADTGKEIPIFSITKRLYKINVSSDGDRFIVDIDSPQALEPGMVPFIEVEGGKQLLLKPTLTNRFETGLDEPHFKHAHGDLVVKAGAEIIIINIPFVDKK